MSYSFKKLPDSLLNIFIKPFRQDFGKTNFAPLAAVSEHLPSWFSGIDLPCPSIKVWSFSAPAKRVI
jgi:hypothetical protein